MSLLTQASLVVTPSAYKEGKLYSVIPSDGSGDMSVVRATTATRVNSAGLVELVPYNLFTYSSSFSNAAWAKINATVTSGQSGYDGTNNAFLITDNSTNGVHLIGQTPIVSGQHTVSIYAKANTLNWLWLRGVQSSANVRAWFNLSTGTVGTVETNGTANIENVGNGWYRCELTIANHESGFEFYVGVSNANGVTSYVGSGQSLYIQDAQLVEGSVAKDYQKTETRLNIPRLDYSNGTCPSLLVEPQRTNLALYSSSFDNADWNNSGLTITANQTISPSGVQDADLFDDGTAANTVHWMWQGQSLANSTTYTISFYAKYVSRKNIVVNIYNGSTSQFVNYNIQNGSILGSIGDVTATIESVGNGWYRCTYTRTMASSGSPNYRIGLSDDSGNQSYTGSNKQAYIWGAQLEAGSYATSYIPTTSASVTRNADVISKTGISSLIGQTEGVMFADFVCDGFEDYGTPLSINDGTASNYIWLTTFANGNIRAEVYNGSVQASITYTGGVVGQRYKVAFAYKQNDFVMYVNGTQIGADASGNVPPSLSRIDYNLVNNWSLALLNVNATALWKTRLTNDQLEQLTGIGFNTYAEMANYYNYTLQ